MKIGHLDTGRDWRGGQAQVLHLMRGLRGRGHVSLLLAPAGPLLERAEREGFEVARWRPLGEWDLLAAATAARTLRRAGAQVVHAHTARAHALGALAARMLGLPIVVSRRVPLAPRGNPLSRLKYRLGADRYLCVSRRALESLERAGVPAARLVLVPSGIEPPGARDAGAEPRGEPPDLRESIGAPAGARVVGTTAALTREKDHAGLLEAAAAVVREHPEARFVWIGEGAMRGDLERRRAELGLEDRVHLLGFRPDALGLARQFTLFVLPSRFEGLGTSILDAQAAGVPVIATAVGGVPEIVEDGVTGRLVPPGDTAALARAIAEALRDPAPPARWAERAREASKAYGLEPMIERTLEQYRLVAEPRPER